jgi:hypothetical protein
VTAAPQAIPALTAPGTFGIAAGVTAPLSEPTARPLSLAELPADIHVLSVGYDMSKLESVMETLARAAAIIRETRKKELEAGPSSG